MIDSSSKVIERWCKPAIPACATTIEEMICKIKGVQRPTRVYPTEGALIEEVQIAYTDPVLNGYEGCGLQGKAELILFVKTAQALDTAESQIVRSTAERFSSIKIM